MSANTSTSAIASAPSVASEKSVTVAELGEAWFEQASLLIGPLVVRRGRPRTPAPKVAINIRLSPDVLARFKANGRGWQTRINLALEDWLAHHPDVG